MNSRRRPRPDSTLDALRDTPCCVHGGTVVDAYGERLADLRIGADGRIVAGRRRRSIRCRARRSSTRRTASSCPAVSTSTPICTCRSGPCAVSDDFRTGTIAAAIGGTTTIVDYVTAYRGEDPMAALATWRRWAEPAVVDYGLHMTFTEAVPEAAIAALRRGGGHVVQALHGLPRPAAGRRRRHLDIMVAAGRHGGLVTLHAENGGAIEALRRRALAEGRTGVIEHARTRPAVLEGEAVARAAALAEVAGVPVYIVHVSSAPALAAVREAQDRGVDILAETCPQYLHLDVSTARRRGRSRLRLHAAAARPVARRGAVGRTGAGDGAHGRDGPLPVRRRPTGAAGTRPARGYADFTEIPGGLPGIETRLGAGLGGGARPGGSPSRTGCGCAPRRRRGRSGCGRPRDRSASAPMPTWSCGTRPAASPSTPRDLHMHVDHSPYAGRVGGGLAPAGALPRAGRRPRRRLQRRRPGWGRYVARTPRAGARG